ncbi:MAG: hypothetical protein RI897_2362 [Verrucomicrobiota bacterium]
MPHSFSGCRLNRRGSGVLWCEDSEAPGDGAIAVGLVLFPSALKQEPQVVRVHGQCFIRVEAEKFPVADVVGPGFHSRGGSHVSCTGEGVCFAIRQRPPFALETVGEVGLVVAATGGVGLDEGQVGVAILEFIGVAGLEDVVLECDRAVAESGREFGERCPEAPHASVEAGEEEIGVLVVTDDPVIEAADGAGVGRFVREDPLCFGPRGRVRDIGGGGVGDVHELSLGQADLVDQVPFCMRPEIEHLRGAVIVTVGKIQDCARGLVGLGPICERAGFHDRAALAFDGREDVPAVVMEDDCGVFGRMCDMGGAFFG